MSAVFFVLSATASLAGSLVFSCVLPQRVKRQQCAHKQRTLVRFHRKLLAHQSPMCVCRCVCVWVWRSQSAPDDGKKRLPAWVDGLLLLLLHGRSNVACQPAAAARSRKAIDRRSIRVTFHISATPRHHPCLLHCSASQLRRHTMAHTTVYACLCIPFPQPSNSRPGWEYKSGHEIYPHERFKRQSEAVWGSVFGAFLCFKGTTFAESVGLKLTCCP